MIVSCMSIHVHIMRLCVRYDHVQCCEDTVSVELRYINYDLVVAVVVVHLLIQYFQLCSISNCSSCCTALRVEL